MKIHEYQAKTLLKQYGVPVPDGRLAESPEEATEVAARLDSFPVLVKAQVHTSGRGRAGATQRARDVEHVESATRAILGLTVQGAPVHRVWIERAVAVERECLVALTVDPARRCPILKVSAVETDESLALTIQPGLGLCGFQIRQAVGFLALPPATHTTFDKICRAMERVLMECDASTIAIRPLALTPDEELVALDVKMEFDDRALARHPRIEAMRLSPDTRSSLPRCDLDGRIVCLATGSGLAMATMDAVRSHDGDPAGWIDLGATPSLDEIGGALTDAAARADVQTLALNVVGNRLRCDRIAERAGNAIERAERAITIGMRLTGPNRDEAARMTQENERLFLASDTRELAARSAQASGTT